MAVITLKVSEGEKCYKPIKVANEGIE
jgi:hypothetical protein